MAAQDVKLSEYLLETQYIMNCVTGKNARDCVNKISKMFNEKLIKGAISLDYGIKFRICYDEKGKSAIEAEFVTEVY